MTGLSVEQASWFAGEAAKLGANIQQVIKGKPDIVEHALVALFSEGHLLL
ncbi:MAG: ATPase, partial [bacterium]|nr:ATPase [bacterium]